MAHSALDLLQSPLGLLEVLAYLADRDVASPAKAIVELDNGLFISDDEKAWKAINPKSSIEDLKLNTQQIMSRVLRAMTAD